MLLHFPLPLDKTAMRAESASSASFFFLPHLAEMLGAETGCPCGADGDGTAPLRSHRSSRIPHWSGAANEDTNVTCRDNLSSLWCSLSPLTTKQDLSSPKEKTYCQVLSSNTPSTASCSVFCEDTEIVSVECMQLWRILAITQLYPVSSREGTVSVSCVRPGSLFIFA